MEELMQLLESIEPALSTALLRLEQETKQQYQYWTKTLNEMTLGALAEKMGLETEDIEGKEILLRLLRMPCDRAIMDAGWDAKKLPLFLGISVEWDDHSDGSQIKPELLCDELKVLSETSKFEILLLLQKRAAYGQELAGILNLDAATVSRHINVLLKYNLLYLERKEGRHLYYRTNQEELRNMIALLSQLFLKGN